MKRPPIINFDRFDEYLFDSLAPALASLFDRGLKRLRKITNIGFLLISILSLGGCQPALWGGPPPAPTLIAPTASATFEIPPFPTIGPTITPMPPTSAPTPVVLNAAQVWATPVVPGLLREKLQDWGFQVLTAGPGSANLYIDISESAEGAMHVSTWTYALVAPFPTLIDGITSQDLLSIWNGSSSGPFANTPILMEETTLATFTALWGAPAENAAQVVSADLLLDTAWNQMPSLAIIPFEKIEPKWKVLTIDGQSPIQKKFDPVIYPLIAQYRLMCVDTCQMPGSINFSFQNRDPHKLATVILTGVTALVRATARTMNTKGILYPGEIIRDMLREADILHISNEVPFYGGCPAPDPNQARQLFCSNPKYIELLTDIGTDVIELSGDHFFDYKEQGMYETLAIYNNSKLPYYGGGMNVEDGRKPYLIEVNGNKLMFIGCNIKRIYAKAAENIPGAVLCDFDYITKQIAYYRSQGYLPISTFQYHEFDTPEARPQQVIDFEKMANAGAIIVSGSQAHVPQVMEFHQDAFVHYGLGNLFFDQMAIKGPDFTQREFIDRHVFYDGKYLGVELITTYLTDFSRPRFMTEKERTKFLTEYFIKSGWDFPQAGQ